MGMHTMFRNYRTIVAALAVAMVVIILVFFGRLDPVRAALTIGICWVVATHSADSFAHKAEIVAALELTAKAGVQWRTGQQQAAIATAEVGVKEICLEVRADMAATRKQEGQS